MTADRVLTSSLLFSGESGSGKTESSKAFLQQLIYLNSRASEEKSHVPTEIYNSAFVLESFGNASTAFNTNSSRFNKYLELQFDVDGTIAGAKIVTFSLEIYRIAQLPAGERLFHVFNYLLAGATAEERSKLKLSDRFAYLEAGASGSRGGDKEDAEGMASLRLVMKTLGFTKKVQSSIFQTLAALLHLGNVEFDQETFHANDQAYVKNRDHLEFVAELLEVDAEALESALTNRSALVGDTMCTDFLNIAQAREARDGLVATIYSLLFTYILEHLNTRLSNNAGSNFVGLMDFAGFESGTKNGFPQLVNNYAAEKINRFVQEDLLDGPQRLLASEGLTIAHPATASQSCLELFEARPNGLIAVLDAEAQKQDRGLAAPEIAGLIAHGIGKSPFLGVSEQAKGRFSVRHYAQPVMYEASGLIQRNKTTVSADYIKLFRSLSGKNKTFLAGLFNEAKLETKKHPKNARAVVGGRRLLSTRRPTVRQPGRKSMLFEAAPRTPLSAFANSTKVSTEGLNVRTSILASSYNSLNTPLTPGTEELSKTSVFSHFRDSLDELISTFKEARCWFVVGINPNGGMQPGVFKDDKVKQQITAFELVKMAKALHEDYTVNCTFSYFLNRYWPLLFPEEDQSKDVEGPIAELKRMVGETIGKMGWTSQQAVAGKDKIFIAENLWRSLESQLDLLLPGEMRRIHRAPLTPEERDEYAHWEDQMAATGLIAGGASPIDAAGKPVLGGKALSRASLINLDVTALDEEALTGTGEAGEAKAAASPAKEEPPARKASCTRRCWTGITTFNTWWIPDYFLIKCGRMKREDVRQAWREKVSCKSMLRYDPN